MGDAVNILSKVYYNTSNPAGFGGARKLYSAVKLIDNRITYNDVLNFLRKQSTYTLHRPARRRFPRNKIYVSYINEMFEADLVDLSMFSRMNNSYKYILTVIDCFSKFLFAEPLKTKTPLEIINAFKKIIKIRQPMKLRTDRGLEFNNKHFKKFCDENEINFFTSYNSNIKCAIVERVNRTIKGKMFRIFSYKGTRRWIDILPAIVNSYNNSVHRTTKLAPSNVNFENEQTVFKNIYGVRNLKEIFFNNSTPKFSIGETVRIKYDLSTLDKSYYPLWSENIYKVKDIIRKYNKPQYVLELEGQKLNRRFYEEEIQKVLVDENNLWRIESILRYRDINGERQALVKWLGYSNKHNSWIPVNQIQRNS